MLPATQAGRAGPATGPGGTAAEVGVGAELGGALVAGGCAAGAVGCGAGGARSTGGGVGASFSAAASTERLALGLQ